MTWIYWGVGSAAGLALLFYLYKKLKAWKKKVDRQFKQGLGS